MDDKECAVTGGRGLSRLAKRAAEAAVKTNCAECHRRVPVDDREVRRVGSQHFVFHRECARAGAIRKRVELAETRTPAARRERQALRQAIERARRSV
jgi:hypothetical protein